LERLKILLSGMVAGDPHQGGATWAVLQYLASLRSLGHEVMLVEPISQTNSLDPDGEVVSYFRSLPLLDDKAALLVQGTDDTVGLSFAQISKFAASADLLLNISGMLRDERLLGAIPVRAFLDLDPGFNQVWQMTGEDMGFELHTHHVTVGLGLGDENCPIPTCGREWIHTLPPVALDLWPAAGAPPDDAAFTTVGHWRSYGSICHEGLHYGQRAHSLRELIELPRLSEGRFQLALGIHPDEESDLAALRACGWELLDPLSVAGTPEAYARFVHGSKAELSIAKSGYVVSRSGWFSDRSACYLASGRPVVAQETGFGPSLPAGQGLLTFESLADAAGAVDEVRSAWWRHSDAARQLAEEHFDGRKVLARLLETLASGRR
jgi:hypothetical protein